MKRKLIALMMLTLILSGSIANFRQATNYIAEDDKEIEWHSYNDEIAM